ncbi:MAG: copper chaperone PCu(A)C [Mariprofundaceae bacterium]
MNRFLYLVMMFFVGMNIAVAENALIADHAWVRMPPPVADTAAAYMQLHNHSKQPLAITSITSSAAEKCEVHEMDMSDGMMHMRKLEKPIIPAGGSLQLAPGGLHLMLIGLKSELHAGQEVKFQIHLNNNDVITVKTSVKDMRQQPTHHH